MSTVSIRDGIVLPASSASNMASHAQLHPRRPAEPDLLLGDRRSRCRRASRAAQQPQLPLPPTGVAASRAGYAWTRPGSASSQPVNFMPPGDTLPLAVGNQARVRH